MTKSKTELTVTPMKPLSNLKITLIALLAGAISFALLLVATSYYKKSVVDKILKSNAVKNADESSRDAVESSIQEIHRFFEDAKKNVPEFVDKVLGIKSKFYAASEYIPFVEDGKSQKYISDCFEETVFSNQELENLIERSIRNYFNEVEDVENLMLYNLRDDLPDVNTGDTHELSLNLVLQLIREQQKDLTPQLTGIATEETVASVTNFLVTEIMTAVATKLVISSGIMGFSGASAAETFGISIVVGIVVDALFSFAWDKIKDPKGTLITVMNNEFDKTEDLIIAGDGDKWIGLRSYLEKLNDARTLQRKEILRRVLSSAHNISEIISEDI